MKQLILAAAILFGCQAIFAQNSPSASPDRQPPEIVILSPKQYSKHNSFPSFSGTAIDKSSFGYNNETIQPSGIMEVKICIFADGKVWNGREWFRAQSSEEFFLLRANVSGENWTISDNLPAVPKQSDSEPKKTVENYNVSIEVTDNAGNKNSSAISISVLPLELTVIDANRQFTGVDLSGNTNVSSADLTKLAGLISFDDLNSGKGTSPADMTALMNNMNSQMLNFYSRFRVFAVADGATKLLVVAKGYSPGKVAFKSAPNIEFASECSPKAQTEISVNQLPAVPGINYEQIIAAVNAQIKKFSQACTVGAIAGDSFVVLDSYQKSENEFYWFGVYTVPPDVTPNSPNTFLGQAISLEAVYTPGAANNGFRGQPQPASSAPLFLKRPPVLLVHGLNDNSDSWDLGNNTILQDAGFDVHLLDYRDTNGASFETNKLILLGKTIGVKDNPENEDELVEIRNPGIKDILEEYRKNGIAISKVDVVGHSMGGNLARVFYQQPENRSDTNFNYDNFNQGYIRRLITIGTPHLGSNVANIITRDVAGIDGEKIKWCGNLALWWTALGQGQLSTSLAANTDLAIGSDALSRIENTPIPSHAITTTANVLRGDYVDRYNNISLCPYKIRGLQTDTEANFINSSCAGVPCDLVVSHHSQFGGLKDAKYLSLIENINHGEQISSIPVRQRVAKLLLKGEENFAPDGFPAVRDVSPPPTSLDMFPIDAVYSRRNTVKSVIKAKVQTRKPVVSNGSNTDGKLPKPVGLSSADMTTLAKMPAAQRAQLEKMMRQSINQSRQNINTSQVPTNKAPSSLPHFRTFSGGGLFKINVPQNWREKTLSSLSVSFTPENGEDANGEIIHGMAIEATNESWQSSESAMEALIESAMRKKPFLQAQSPTTGMISNHRAFFVKLSGQSTVSGQNESVIFGGTLLKNGNLLYVAMFFNDKDNTEYQLLFNEIIKSIQIND